jgi:hypothetical protein
MVRHHHHTNVVFLPPPLPVYVNYKPRSSLERKLDITALTLLFNLIMSICSMNILHLLHGVPRFWTIISIFFDVVVCLPCLGLIGLIERPRDLPHVILYGLKSLNFFWTIVGFFRFFNVPISDFRLLVFGRVGISVLWYALVSFLFWKN